MENTKHLIVLAPYMDTLRPGRGMADILPEGLKEAGAKGVVINHCEKSFQKVLGVFMAINQVGFALAAPIFNAFYDLFGSYDGALLLCAGLMMLVFITLQFIINTAHRVRKQVENGELLAQESII